MNIHLSVNDLDVERCRVCCDGGREGSTRDDECPVPSMDADGSDDDVSASGRSNDVTNSDRYRHLVEYIQDAVVEFELIDGEPIVRDLNEAFLDVFGYDHDDLLGSSLNEWIVPEWLTEEARTLDDRTASGEINYKRVRRETSDGLREFLYRGIPYDDGIGRTDGFAVYTDLTEITRSERRLQVLNRVLRHNLRNEANVVSAYTTRLLAEIDDPSTETADAASTIERAAHDLETLAREAGDIRTILEGTEVEDPAVDCVPIIQRAVSEFRRRTSPVAILTDLPESMSVRATGDLRFAVDALIDNAIEHNPTERPRVRVRVDSAEADGWASIRVEDDGPRISADERDVITGDAEITSTCHGSGLGLWLVKWSTELFGGELSFTQSDMGGNSVRIRLPRR